MDNQWVNVKEELPTAGIDVYSKDSIGRVYKSSFMDNQTGGTPYFKLCGYVWHHSNVVEWKVYDGAERVSGYES